MNSVPRRAGTIGMWLFLAALFMLFTASMLAYVLVRTTGSHSPPIGTLRLPRALWASTALILGVSVTFPRALHWLRRERQTQFRQMLVTTLVLAAGFIAIQTPALAQLLRQHKSLQSSGLHLYGLIFVLVLVHALHVLGGVAALGVVTVQGFRGVYDHEHYLPVQHAAMYWHFLDGVWLVMFFTFLVLG